MTAAALLTEWARLFLGSLSAAGVRDVVISPGSRSTPFTWAALAHGELSCHVVIDERSAAYFALGRAAVSGVPTLLVCTSGTAAVNYAPALIEASQSGTPLIVVTADRPFELQRTGASQTIDQVKLYGSAVRGYFELGDPSDGDAALRSLPRLAAQVVLLSRFPEPGPVHVNARARKPFDPTPRGADPELARRVDELLARGPTAVHPPLLAPEAGAIAALAAACRRAARGLIVCGPIAPARPVPSAVLADLARATGFPVWCEATSQARFGGAAAAGADAFGALLGAGALPPELEPDFVLQIGAPPVTAAWERWLELRPGLERAVVTPLPWPDPTATAKRLVVGDPVLVLRALAAGMGPTPSDPASRTVFRRALAAAGERYWEAVAEVVAGDGLSEAAVVQDVVAALPPDGVLALGNSLPVREVDWYVRSGPRPLTVVHQRGTSGIDGVLSSALGAASRLGRPGALLIGDVSLLHDLGGLLQARALPAPFAIVAMNNDGGRIFEHLPLFATPGIEPEKLDAWTTPHGLELFRAGALYDLPALRVIDRAELGRALGAALSRPGATLIEAVVPPHGARDVLAAVRKALGA